MSPYYRGAFFFLKIRSLPWKFPIIVEGYFFRKVRSFYSLLSIYSERIFFCKKKLSRKPLSFLLEVSKSSRGEINYREFLKTSRQRVWEVSNNSRRIFRKSLLKYPRKEHGKFPIIVEGFFWKSSVRHPTNRQANVHIKWTEKEITDYEL